MIALAVPIAAIRIQRVVVFRLGRLRGAHGPGLVLVIPLVDTTRSVSLQAEAERERRAKVIAAEGECQAAARLAQAAHVINREHGALTLRTLQTLAEVATEHNSTLVVPIPLEILDAVRREGAPVMADAAAAHATVHAPNGGGA